MRGRPKYVGRLVQVRLSDVDVEVRRRAARLAVAERQDDAVNPLDRLFSRLVEERGDGELEQLKRVAEHPSDRVYWLPGKAVRAVLG